MKTDIYKNKKTRFLLALLASIYMLFHGRPFDIYRVIISPLFYVALVVSLGIGLIVVYYVHRITLWLDIRCGWRQMPVERTVLQFSLGVVVPALIDLILISIYFQSIGQNVLENDFLLIDYPVIVCLIIFFNLYYLIHYLIVTEKASTIAVDPDQEADEQVATFTVDYKDVSVQLPLSDIFCFYRSSRKVTLITLDHKDYTCASTITNIASQLSEAGYIQINRSVVIKLEAVKGFRKGTRKNTLQLFIKQDQELYFQDLPSDQLLVTKEYIDKFRSEFQSQEEI